MKRLLLEIECSLGNTPLPYPKPCLKIGQSLRMELESLKSFGVDNVLSHVADLLALLHCIGNALSIELIAFSKVSLIKSNRN